MFNPANFVTAFNLVSGISSILFAVLGYLDLAVFAIFAGAIFDFLAGFIERAMKTTGELGKQLDSLADMVTFGVAPGVLMMVVLTIDLEVVKVFSAIDVRLGFTNWVDAFLRGEFNFLPLIALMIPFFSIFRLAKFNLDTRQTSSFIGFPTPANTLFYTTFPLVIVFRIEDVTSFPFDFFFSPIVICSLIIVLSLMLVSEVPLFSLKVKSFKLNGNEIRFAFLLISLIFILVFNVWAIALIVLLYLILSIVENTFFNKNKNEI